MKKKSAIFLVLLLFGVGTVYVLSIDLWATNNFICKPSLGANGRTEETTFDAGMDRADVALAKTYRLGDPLIGTTLPDALANVPDNSTLFIPRGTYTLTISSTITIRKNLNIVCAPGVVLDATSSTALPCLFKFTGSVGTYYALGGAVTKGDRTITLNETLAASLSEGDLIKITTDNNVGGAGTQWCYGTSSYWKGEIAEVLSRSGTTITLKNMLCDDYVAADTVAAKITPIKGSIQGLVLKGTVGRKQIGIGVAYSKDFVVRDCNIQGFGATCLQIAHGYNTLIDHLSASDCLGGTGSDYGLMFASCQTARVINSNIAGGRHAVTTGGWEPCRFISIGPNNTLENSVSAVVTAVSLHENIEDVIISGNHVRNGISLCGQRVEANNNVIEIGNKGFAGISIYVNQNNQYVRAINNRIYCAPAFDQASTVGILVQMLNSAVIRSIDIKGNVIVGNCRGVGVRVSDTSTTCTIETLNIDDNTTDLLLTSAGYDVILQGYDAMHLLNIGDCNIKNNKFRTVFSTEIYANNAAIGGLYVEDNLLWFDGRSPGTSPVYTDTNARVTQARICRNVTKNTSAMPYFNVRVTGFLQFTDNLLHNMSTHGGVLLSGADVLYANNPQVNCSGNIAITGRRFSKIF